MTGCGIIVLCAMLSGAVGYAYGWCRGPEAEYAWTKTFLRLGIEDRSSFLRVTYIHNASYLGGLIGLILALACIHPKREPTNPTPAATSPA